MNHSYLRIRIIISLFIILRIGITISSGQTVKDTVVVDYKAVDITIDEKVHQFGAQDVLVVMDIDNTILTGDNGLGSDIWYQWQNEELDVKPSYNQKLAKDCLFNEAIGLLYELGTMSLTDSLLPGYISKWQNSGVTIFALTSRSPKYRAATERELKRNKIDLTVSELSTLDGQELILSYSLGRELSYMNGIMMTSGMNKGEMLSHILGRSGRSFKALIFVDDSRKNIDAVKTKYSSCINFDIVLFHYTKIITERLRLNNNVILTPEQAVKMDQDWDLLIRTLNTLFPERLAKSDCKP